MKKVIIIAIVSFISVSALAQMRFGIKAGVNASVLSGIDYNGLGPTGGSYFYYGCLVGGYADYSLSRLFGFQPEVLFSMQGGKYPDINGKRGTNHFNYINIPLLLNIKHFNSPFSFLIGPQFGYCISRSFFSGDKIANNNYYKDFDFAIAVGMQYYITKHLLLGLRYNHGLIKSLNCDYEYSYEGVNYKGTAKGERNNVLQLSLGWTF